MLANFEIPTVKNDRFFCFFIFFRHNFFFFHQFFFYFFVIISVFFSSKFSIFFLQNFIFFLQNFIFFVVHNFYIIKLVHKMCSKNVHKILYFFIKKYEIFKKQNLQKMEIIILRLIINCIGLCGQSRDTNINKLLILYSA